MSSICDSPEDAVKKFKIITGENVFERLLDYLELSESEFTKEYGDKLAADPSTCNHLLVEMVRGSFTRGVDLK